YRKKLMIGSMPVIVRSRKCNLYDKPQEFIYQQKEDPGHQGGYFIIGGRSHGNSVGHAQQITMQERMALDNVCIYEFNTKKKKTANPSKVAKKGETMPTLYAEIKCSLKGKPAGTSLIRVGFTDDPTHGIQCVVPFIPCPHRVPFGVLLKAYGLKEDEMIKTIIKPTDPASYLEMLMITL